MTAVNMYDARTEATIALYEVANEWDLPVPAITFVLDQMIDLTVSTVDDVAAWTTALALQFSVLVTDESVATGEWHGWRVAVRAGVSS